MAHPETIKVIIKTVSLLKNISILNLELIHKEIWILIKFKGFELILSVASNTFENTEKYMAF